MNLKFVFKKEGMSEMHCISILTGMMPLSIGFRVMCSLRMYRLWRLHLLESLSLK